MHFVDNATPQQLQQMVAARNPYSYMALSKLQEIRDNKMKAEAKQPESPPLSQVIPQQVAQLENKGIASLPQQAPQMPPQMPPGMPPQMPPQQPPQQPPMQAGIGEGMAAAGAAGGLVSFKHGGIAHFYQGGNDELTNIYLGGIPNVLTPEYIRGKKNPEYNKPVVSVSSNPAQSVPIITTPESLNAQNIGYTINESGEPMQGTPMQGTQPLREPTPADVAAYDRTTQTNQKAPTNTSNVGIKTPNLTEAFKAKQDFLNTIESQSPRFNPEKWNEPRKNQAQDTQSVFEGLQKALPSESAAIRSQIKDLQKANEGESSQAPAMAMLKMATALMATKSPHFLQALGEAGGAGLEDYQKIMALQKQQKLKLLEADANMAAAQDARNMNLMGVADQRVERGIQAKEAANKMQIDSDATKFALQMKIGAMKAGLPLEKIEEQYKLAQMAAQIHHLTAVPKPAAVAVYEYGQTHPEFREHLQNAQSASKLEDYLRNINKDYEDLRSTVSKDMTGQAKLPSYNDFVQERLKVYDARFPRGVARLPDSAFQ
jgi:hypothetical protein